MRIRVTSDHIFRGKKGVANSCPIALALSEQTLIKDWDVTQPKGAVDKVNGTTYALPEEAKNFIRVFDTGGIATPFEFNLV